MNCSAITVRQAIATGRKGRAAALRSDHSAPATHTGVSTTPE
jgi:hypothetical protein